MEFFFEPKGIAVIGATPNRMKGGNAIMQNLINGFEGGIYPVNPRYETIEGIACYPSVAAVPDPVDIAIVFVPAKGVPAAIGQCVERGIKGVMIESGGFSESGPEGKKLQEELALICRETGIRLWGPNCMGLVDIPARHVFSFVAPVIWEEGLVPGKISLVVQSGMLSGGFLIDLMTHGITGVSKVCSVGNKVDVNECDLLEYLMNDPATQAIGLYLEGIPEGRRFLDLCRRSEKPIVVLKGGKSRAGATAALSHTASMAGNGALVKGALAQAGVVEAVGFKEMMDVCRSLAEYPEVPAGSGRVAVLTYSGGGGIVSADALEGAGLGLAGLSEKTVSTVQTISPDWLPIANPMDLWAAVERSGAQKVYETAALAALDDPGVDALFIHAFAGGFRMNVDFSSVAARAEAMGKPVVMWLLGTRKDARFLQAEIQSLGIPVFREINRAVACLKAVCTPRPKFLAPSDDASLPAPVADALRSARGVFDEHRAKRLLSASGVPVVTEAVAGTLEEALSLARAWGFPVAAKGLLEEAVHKTEANLVHLDLRTDEAVKSAMAALHAAMGGKGRVLLQQMVQGGPEIIVGALRDAQFGPAVMVGLGGTLAEVLDDKVFAVAPLSKEEALLMIGRLKHQRLLDGFRGAAPVDREALADILVAVGRLAAAEPRVMEIDINPLICVNGKPVAVDASVVLSGKGA